MGFFEYFIRYTLVRCLNRILKPKYLLAIIIILVALFLLKNECFGYNEDDPWSSPNLYDIYDWSNKAWEYDSLSNNYKIISYNGVHGKAIFVKPNVTLDISFTSGVSELHWGVGTPDGSIPIVDSYIAETAYNGSSATYGMSGFSTAKNSTILGYDTSGGCWLVFYSIDSDVDTLYVSNIIDVSDTGRIQSSISDAALEITQQQRETTGAVENLTDEINIQTSIIDQQSQFLQENPDANNFSSSDLPSDNTQDITQDGINNIFIMFYNTFTRAPSSTDVIEIEIPFTGKSFTIPYDYTSTYVPSGLKSIINMFWYFIISVFIVKDILNKIQKIKSGDMENMQNSNIKGDLL